MHELGYASELVSTLQDFMDENHLSMISKVVLSAGEATGIVPRFMYECWPAVIEDEPRLKDCELEVRVAEAMGRCHNCEAEFPILKSKNRCPKCGCADFDFENGYEFEITEIHGK